MTRKEAKKFLPIIQAFAEGKTIQCRYLRQEIDWYDVSEASFEEHENVEYRIKPDPKVIWVNEYEEIEGYCVHPTEEDAIKGCSDNVLRRAVKYVEVIE